MEMLVSTSYWATSVLNLELQQLKQTDITWLVKDETKGESSEPPFEQTNYEQVYIAGHIC